MKIRVTNLCNRGLESNSVTLAKEALVAFAMHAMRPLSVYEC